MYFQKYNAYKLTFGKSKLGCSVVRLLFFYTKPVKLSNRKPTYVLPRKSLVSVKSEHPLSRA